MSGVSSATFAGSEARESWMYQLCIMTRLHHDCANHRRPEANVRTWGRRRARRNNRPDFRSCLIANGRGVVPKGLPLSLVT